MAHVRRALEAKGPGFDAAVATTSPFQRLRAVRRAEQARKARFRRGGQQMVAQELQQETF